MTKSFRTLIGAAPSSATPTDSTLIIIDAQNEYATGLLKTVNVDHTRAAIEGLLGKYRDAGGEVVHVVHRTSGEAPVFTMGTALEGEMRGLEAGEGEKVSRTYMSFSCRLVFACVRVCVWGGRVEGGWRGEEGIDRWRE